MQSYTLLITVVIHFYLKKKKKKIKKTAKLLSLVLFKKIFSYFFHIIRWILGISF